MLQFCCLKLHQKGAAVNCTRDGNCCVCAVIRSIDTAEALAIPGVVTFVSFKDIPGSNMTGPAVYDETVLAEDTVTSLASRVILLCACACTSGSGGRKITCLVFFFFTNWFLCVHKWHSNLKVQPLHMTHISINGLYSRNVTRTVISKTNDGWSIRVLSSWVSKPSGYFTCLFCLDGQKTLIDNNKIIYQSK